MGTLFSTQLQDVLVASFEGLDCVKETRVEKDEFIYIVCPDHLKKNRQKLLLKYLLIHTICKAFFHCFTQYKLFLMLFKTCISLLVNIAVYNFTIWLGGDRLLVKRDICPVKHSQQRKAILIFLNENFGVIYTRFLGNQAFLLKRKQLVWSGSVNNYTELRWNCSQILILMLVMEVHMIT